MVSGLCCEYAPVTSASLCVVLSLVLKVKLKPLKALSLLTSTSTSLICRKYYRILLLVTLVFLTGPLCCTDPADIPSEDGFTADQDTGGGH